MNNNFTVITTAFNDEKNICKYFDQILKQSLLPDRIILVDGGSTDNTVCIANKIKKESNILIEIITGQRLNIAEAFNLGIKESKTDYVIITCIGNLFSNTMCEDLYKTITENDSDAAYGLLQGVNRGIFSNLYNSCFIASVGNDIMSNRCVIYNKRTFEKIGYFIENFHYAGEDAEFLKRFKDANLFKVLVNRPTVFWETPNSFSEFKKQRKNYCIAELQYADFNTIFNQNIKKNIKRISLICLGACFFILPFIAIYCLLLYIMDFIKLVCTNKSVRKSLFLIYTPILRSYFYLRYFTYYEHKRVV